MQSAAGAKPQRTAASQQQIAVSMKRPAFAAKFCVTNAARSISLCTQAFAHSPESHPAVQQKKGPFTAQPELPRYRCHPQDICKNVWVQLSVPFEWFIQVPPQDATETDERAAADPSYTEAQNSTTNIPEEQVDA